MTTPVAHKTMNDELCNYVYKKETMTKDEFIKTKILGAFENYLSSLNLLFDDDVGKINWEYFGEYYKAVDNNQLTFWEFITREWDISLEEADFMADFIYNQFKTKYDMVENKKSILNPYYAEKIETMALLMAYSYDARPIMYDDIYKEFKKVINKLEQN